ncbi:MAG: MBL fold metallo-hydrolase [Parvularculaceae bacterium]
MAREELVFLPLGGSGEIGMNMNLYGFGPPHARKWIMIDCGVLFGDLSTPGIDIITPDPAFILEHKKNLKALILTHGHEDHIGAVAPRAEIRLPGLRNAVPAALVRRKLAEAETTLDLRVVDMSARFEIGPFDIEFVTLTHSFRNRAASSFERKLGNVLHTGDWKIDPSRRSGRSRIRKRFHSVWR